MLRFVGLLFKVVCVAVAYYITGKLGLLLAIPPGFSSVIWPSSGIALASLLIWGPHCWLGIFLGSLFINFSTSYGNSIPISSMEALPLFFTIAVGASLQPTLSSYSIPSSNLSNSSPKLAKLSQ